MIITASDLFFHTFLHSPINRYVFQKIIWLVFSWYSVFVFQLGKIIVESLREFLQKKKEKKRERNARVYEIRIKIEFSKREKNREGERDLKSLEGFCSRLRIY